MTTRASSTTTTMERASLRTSPFGSRDAAAHNLRVVRLGNITEGAVASPERPKANPASIQDDSIVFGDFRVLPAKRLLLKGGSPVDVGARAFDVLVTLAERPGQVVSRKEIEARAYPGLTVSEGALRFQIAALRKTLGDGRDGSRYIANVSGRGYCFAAPVVRSDEAPPPALPGSNDNGPSDRQRETDNQSATRSIRTAVENRSDIADVISAIAPVAHSDGPITVVFSLLGRRATLILDDLSSAGCRA